MTDWSEIASLATGAGTLVLAIATFSSVRASQRSARIAEQVLLVNQRPVLAPASETDPSISVTFGDRHFTTVAGGLAAVELEDDHFYFVLPLRNVGAGIAVLHAWQVTPTPTAAAAATEKPDLTRLRAQQRDLYIPVGTVGFWQGALRERDDEMRAGIDDAYAAGERLTLDILYGDHEGGQRVVTRFSLVPFRDGAWLPGVTRHWRLDGVNPRE
jgi:hypothetical protein